MFDSSDIPTVTNKTMICCDSTKIFNFLNISLTRHFEGNLPLTVYYNKNHQIILVTIETIIYFYPFSLQN
jgi:hypothetical protein